MALRIITNSNEEIKVHGGDWKPYELINHLDHFIDFDDIKCVIASGQELADIKELFIDKHNGRPTIPLIWDIETMRWYGSIAKTIVANL